MPPPTFAPLPYAPPFSLKRKYFLESGQREGMAKAQGTRERRVNEGTNEGITHANTHARKHARTHAHKHTRITNLWIKFEHKNPQEPLFTHFHKLLQFFRQANVYGKAVE